MSTRQKILFLLGIVITFRPTLSFCGEEAAQVPTHQPGLVAYYSFDEGKGNVVKDLSGNGNDGTVSPNAKWVKLTDPFAVQLFGYALEMSAAVHCGRGPTLDLAGNHLTLEAWFEKLSGSPGSTSQPGPRRFRYSLAELMAQCDASAPLSAEDRAWIDAPSIGREA